MTLQMLHKSLDMFGELTVDINYDIYIASLGVDHFLKQIVCFNILEIYNAGPLFLIHLELMHFLLNNPFISKLKHFLYNSFMYVLNYIYIIILIL